MSEQLTQTDQEYLTFMLGREEFGVDILCVQEIKVWSPVTEIPNMPKYIKGVINLRGVIVPIVDLRERFNQQVNEYTVTTVVIVLKGRVENREALVGIVVDSVSDVYKAARDEVKDAPDFGSKIDNQFIKGMVALEQKIIILLDEKKLLDVDELFGGNMLKGQTS